MDCRHHNEIEKLNDKLVDASHRMAAARKIHDEYVEELLRKISKIEKGCVTDTQNTIKNIVDWKASAGCLWMRWIKAK